MPPDRAQKLTKKQRTALRRSQPQSMHQTLIQQRTQVTIQHHPLVSPEALARYKEIDPQIVADILQGVQEERAHRHRMEEKELALIEEADDDRTGLDGFGMLLGSLIAFTGLGLGTWLALEGREQTASIMVGISLSSIIYAALARVRKKPPTRNGEEPQ